MDNFEFGMFGEMNEYNDREEFDNDGDYIPGMDDGEWETDDEWLDMDQAWNDEFEGEEEFA